MLSSFNFDSVANEYDNYYTTLLGQQIDDEEKLIISSLTNIVKPCDMVEVGSGTGHWTSYFASKGFKVTGVDISKEMINRAQQKNISSAKFIEASATDLPFKNKSVRFVAMITTLEFIKKPSDAIDEINRVLIPGGYVLIAGLNSYSTLGQNKIADPVLKHGNFLTPESLKEILFGFGSVVELQGSVFLNADMSLKGKKETEGLTNSERLYSGAFIAGLARKED